MITSYAIREKIPSIFLEKVLLVSSFQEVILFGSTAQNKDRIDSDIDLAIIGKSHLLLPNERDMINDIVVSILLEFGVFINWIYLSTSEMNQNILPIVQSIKQTGVKIWVSERTS